MIHEKYKHKINNEGLLDLLAIVSGDLETIVKVETVIDRFLDDRCRNARATGKGFLT